jgi:hypothetical protein
LGAYLDKELTKNLKNKSYLLYAVNERYGQFKSQGHYVSFIKIKNKEWFRFSDLYVKPSLSDFNSSDVLVYII